MSEKPTRTLASNGVRAASGAVGPAAPVPIAGFQKARLSIVPARRGAVPIAPRSDYPLPEFHTPTTAP